MFICNFNVSKYCMQIHYLVECNHLTKYDVKTKITQFIVTLWNNIFYLVILSNCDNIKGEIYLVIHIWKILENIVLNLSDPIGHYISERRGYYKSYWNDHFVSRISCESFII